MPWNENEQGTINMAIPLLFQKLELLWISSSSNFFFVACAKLSKNSNKWYSLFRVYFFSLAIITIHVRINIYVRYLWSAEVGAIPIIGCKTPEAKFARVLRISICMARDWKRLKKDSGSTEFHESFHGQDPKSKVQRFFFVSNCFTESSEIFSSIGPRSIGSFDNFVRAIVLVE